MVILNGFSAGNDTELLQSAIDCAAEKNDTLFINRGVYTVTTLFLKGNNRIIFEDGVIIKPSDSAKWVNNTEMPIFSAVDAENISLTGNAALWGGKDRFINSDGKRKNIPRPENILRFVNSKNISVTGLTLLDSVGWTFNLNNCKDVYINNITIRNDTYEKSANSDGIDINGCRNVVIENCDISTGDDGICLKNINPTDFTAERNDMYNIRVRNCVIASTCNATKIGTETVGNIYDVCFENIRVRKHLNVDCSLNPDKTHPYYDAIAAICVQSNDGASVHDITFKNYTVDSVQVPFFILLMNRKTKKPDAVLGEVKNITIDGLTVKKAFLTSCINVSKGGVIKNITLDNILVDTYEEKPEYCENEIPDASHYPDANLFGKFSSYGLFARNTENLSIGNNVKFNDKSNTGRPDIYCDINKEI